MTPTQHVDTEKLRAAVEKSNALLEQIQEILKPFLVTPPQQEAAAMPRVRQGIEPAARAMAHNIVTHPALARRAGFDAGAVTSELQAVEALQAFAERLQGVSQRVVDTKLRWLVDAYVPTLAVDAMVKARARFDGGVRTLVEPLNRMFKKQPPAASGAVVETTAAQAAEQTVRH